ncbi:transglutaminaseTgpA domain-containing protein [Streptomyces sp. NPDC003023]|uniref:transglutaminase family protein n=1 Tax=Streptomyces sp. NPDC003023 TaxID=3364675 RepID=UPI00367CD3E2
MSGRGRLTVCAFAATLMAAAAILPLVDPPNWLFQAAFLLAIQSGAGALARRVPLARPLTLAVQVLVTVLALTVVFARGQAVLGVLPGPDAFARFAELLRAGADDVGQYAIPAPATDGIRLMVIGGVLVIGLVVDALAVTFRTAAPAGLPLLALYSVAAGLSGGGTSWLWFLLAATGYLLLLLAEGRDRLSQWGRVFGGAAGGRNRSTGGFDPTEGRPQAPIRAGRRIGVLALGVALVVPAALPALDGGLLGGVGNGPGGGDGGGGTISAVNPLVSLQDDLNQPQNREVLRYRSNATDNQEMYLRILALDRFDGTSWRSSERKVTGVPDRLPEPAGLSPSVQVTEVKTNLSAAGSYRQNWLPMPYPATTVAIDGRWRYEPAGRTLVGDRSQTTAGVQYSVSSLIVKPTREQLAEAPAAPAPLLQEYTQVPDVLPDDVRRTALTVTEGASNDYERAARLEDWFSTSGGFTYSTEVRSGTGVSAISRFLKQKEGFCIHFSFSMAAMARTLDIPARVAVGFQPGTAQSDGTVSVGLRDAHAWPELYFEGVGWTRFEPTPRRGFQPEYTQEQAPTGSPSDPAQPEAGTSAAPEETNRPQDACPRQERQMGECGAAEPRDVQPPAAAGSALGTVVLTALGVVAGLLLLSVPLLLRLMARSRRLTAPVRRSAKAPAPPPGPDAHLPGSSGVVFEAGGTGTGGRTAVDVTRRTLAAWQEVTDSAWDVGILPDDALTPRKAAARIVRLGKLEDEPAAAVHRMARSVEQVLYAPVPQSGGELAADARRIQTGLIGAVGFGTRMRALLLPRSSVRVVWALSERWSAVTDRWNVRRLRLDRWAEVLRRPLRQRG